MVRRHKAYAKGIIWLRPSSYLTKTHIQSPTQLHPPNTMQTTVPHLLSFLLLIQFTSSVVSRSLDNQDEINQLVDNKMEELRKQLTFISPLNVLKRAHNIDTRGLQQFKNCYFSPIQCVLMERKK